MNAPTWHGELFFGKYCDVANYLPNIVEPNDEDL